MLCLDTNVVIMALNGRAPGIAERLEFEITRGSVAIPSIAVFELYFGVTNSVKREENARRLAAFLGLPILILDFDADDAAEAAAIRADLKRAGTPIGPYDVLIAAQARRRGATLVTANTREYARVADLRLEDWTRA